MGRTVAHELLGIVVVALYFHAVADVYLVRDGVKPCHDVLL
jgi:hypothetical protein